MAKVDDDELSVVPGRRQLTTRWAAWLADPRTAVLTFLGAALLIGGGRKVLQNLRARRAVAALGESHPSVEEVEAASDHGRAALIELYRLLSTAESAEVRDAAGRTLARLWAKDDLIVEEEKALVRRGFAVAWKARRRYPRALAVPIPIEASYGVPFLVDGSSGVGPSNLVWSHRILGAQRARLEEDSAWIKGPGLARFAVEPVDFADHGQHRIVLATRVRVVGLTDSWEIELPHVPFSFEFDPIMTVDALLTSLDDARASSFNRAVRLEPVQDTGVSSRYLDLSSSLVFRDPPDLVVSTPLPCDLAHQLAIEIENIPGQFRAGSVVVSGQGDSLSGSTETRRLPLESIEGIPPDAIDRPGDYRIRAILTADANLGWADPDVRSLWPGTMTTEWASVKVIRR